MELSLIERHMKLFRPVAAPINMPLTIIMK